MEGNRLAVAPEIDIRVGVVSTSWWADKMYLPALKSHPQVEITAICGRNRHGAEDMAAKYGISRVFVDYREMLAAIKPAAVHVSTPHTLHFRHAYDSLAAGASPYGALNMSGIVWEWVADWYQSDYYSQSPADNPTGPATGDFRVIRGGGATSISQDLRVTRRANGEPQHYMDGQMGFRCAMDSSNP